jgi:hypothetical protein
MRRLRTSRSCREIENRIVVNLTDSNASQTDALSVATEVALADFNATAIDAIAPVSLNVAITDHNNGQTDFIHVGNTFGISDFSAAQTDVLTIHISAPRIVETNATQTDAVHATVRASVVDSNATQTDSLIMSLRQAIADSNTTPSDVLIAKVLASMADSNATPSDALVARVLASLAESNAAQTDSLVVTVSGPPGNSELFLEGDLGIVFGTAPNVQNWLDQSGNGHTAGPYENQPVQATIAAYANQLGLNFAQNHALQTPTGWAHGPISGAIPVTTFTIANPTAVNSTTQCAFGSGTSNTAFFDLQFNPVANTIAAFASSTNKIQISKNPITPLAIMIEWNGASSTLRVNQQSVTASGNLTLTGAVTGQCIGNNNQGAGSSALGGPMMLHILYYRLLTSAERLALWNYATTKYGLTIAP